MTMPNFLLIGAARAGTTSLYHYLAQHPDIYMSPNKEPNYFAGERPDSEPFSEAADHGFTTREAYRSLFAGVAGEKAIGEASPCYLWAPQAAERIWRHIPRARLIAVLRDPVARAFSAYLKYVLDGVETRTFAEAIQDERRGVRRPLPVGCHHYLDTGFYHRHLSRYYARFPAAQVQVHLYEDVAADSARVVREIHRFLEVDGSFHTDTSIRYNPSGIPQSRVVAALTAKRPALSRLRKRLPAWVSLPLHGWILGAAGANLARPQLSPEVRADLISGFQEDISRLQELIGRDLSAWLLVQPWQAG